MVDRKDGQQDRFVVGAQPRRPSLGTWRCPWPSEAILAVHCESEEIFAEACPYCQRY